jgi:hypothetical protein
MLITISLGIQHCIKSDTSTESFHLTANHPFEKPTVPLSSPNLIPQTLASPTDPVLLLTELGFSELSWFEVFNKTDQPVELDTYTIRIYHVDRETNYYTINTFPLPSHTLSPKDFAIFSEHPYYPSDAVYFPYVSGLHLLPQQGGFLELVNNQGESVDVVQWGEDHAAIQYAPGGFFIGRVPAVSQEDHVLGREGSVDTDSASDWNEYRFPSHYGWSSSMDQPDYPPLESFNDSSPYTAVWIEEMTSYSGSINAMGDVDFYSFAVAYPQTFEVHVKNTQADPDTTRLFDPKVWVYIPVGTDGRVAEYLTMNNQGAGKDEYAYFSPTPELNRVYIAIAPYNLYMDPYDEPPIDSLWTYELSIQPVARPGDRTDGGPDTYPFWVAYGGNQSTNLPYQIEAKKLGVSDHAVVYGAVDSLSLVEDSWVAVVLDEFEAQIYPWVTGVLGPPVDFDQNGRVVLLFVDIQDGYLQPGDPFLAGIFRPEDLDSYRNSGSNAMEILYLDTNPSLLSPDDRDPKKADNVFETITHELAHLCMFSQNWFYEYGLDESRNRIATWIGEGIAECLSHLAYTPQVSRLDAYKNHVPSAAGVSLMRWDSQHASIQYALSYLFFWYVLNRTGDLAVLGSIVQHADEDLEAMESVLNAYLNTDLSQIYQDWLITNLRYASQQPPIKPYCYSADFYWDETRDHPQQMGVFFSDPANGVYLDEFAHVFFKLDGATAILQPTEAGDAVRYFSIDFRGNLDTDPTDGLECNTGCLVGSFFPRYSGRDQIPLSQQWSGTIDSEQTTQKRVGETVVQAYTTETERRRYQHRFRQE